VVDWLPLDQAAALIGISERHLRRLAEAKAGVGLAQKRPPVMGHGKSTWWLHCSVHPALSRTPSHQTREDRARAALDVDHPPHVVDRAYRKAHWLRAWRAAIADSPLTLFFKGQPARTSDPSRGLQAARTSDVLGLTARAIAAQIVAEAKRLEGDDFRISVRALQLWWRAYNTLGPDGQILGVRGLIDRYGSPPSSKGGPGRAERSAEAADYFYGLYRAPARHSAKTCHAATVEAAKAHGWTWPRSYSATIAWLREHDQRDETCLHREGKRAYSHRYLPHVEIDWTTVEAGEFFQTDHTEVDWWVLDDAGVGSSPPSQGGDLYRPWLTTIIDGRSRCITGWRLGHSPNQDAILAALRMAFGDWGIPRTMRIDRGKDFASELITGVTKRDRIRYRRELGADWKNVLRHNEDVYWHGVLGELDIKIIDALPYHAWSKGQKERWYGTFEDAVAKQFITYCGNNPEHRPECLPAVLAGRVPPSAKSAKSAEKLRISDTTGLPTLADSRARVSDWLDIYHRTAHRGDGMDGATPLAVWQQRTVARVAGETELLALMQSRGVYRVGGNGVRFKVGGSTLGYGASSDALRRFVGRDVWITLDPADVSCCYAYTPARENRLLIGRLQANEKLPSDTPIEQLREAQAALGRRRKTFHRAAAESHRRHRNAAQEISAYQAAKRQQLLATGTDDARPLPVIAPVRTGFEGISVPVRGGFATPIPTPYDAVDFDDLDTATDDADAPDPRRARQEAVADPYADIDLDDISVAPPEDTSDE
jgi:transposase InsO family protein